MRRQWGPRLLVAASLSLAGCGEPVSEAPAKVAPGAGSSVAANDLAGQLMALAPDRADETPLTAERARRLLRACRFETALAGTCRDSSDAVSRIELTEGAPMVVRLVGSADPLAAVAALRSELLCPELTLMASESARAFRLSAPGKKDLALVSRNGEEGLETRLLYSQQTVDCAILQQSPPPTATDLFQNGTSDNLR